MEQISVLNFTDYRAFLKAVLEEKGRKNPTFSLRAFARLAGISPSHLSRTLSGEKRLSASSSHQISIALNHSSTEASHLLGLIELEKASSDEKRNRILRRMTKFERRNSRVVSLDSFRAIADWYHFAILALTNTRGFQNNAQWIAKRLGIRPLEARFAVERMESLGLLQRTPQGNLKAVNDADIATEDSTGTAAIQENHRQHLSMAQTALTEVPVELREFNNLTLTMNLSDVPKAKKMIQAFIERFNEEMETKPAQEVFQLNVQLYLLSKSEKGQS